MKIGITGGIGSGKSYICNILKAKGYPVYNCDDQAKRLMIADENIVKSLTQLIGSEAYNNRESQEEPPGRTLNKNVIAAFLFDNPNNASKINAIVHPRVKADFAEWASKQCSTTVFMECAILFESGFEDAVDHTILVYADEEKRMLRAMKRDNATEHQIQRRMAQQISGTEACKRADYILDHNDYNTTDAEIQKMLSWVENLSNETRINKQ